MKAAYEHAKAGEPGLGGYDRWFAARQRRTQQRSAGVDRHLYGSAYPHSAALLRAGRTTTCRSSTRA